MEKRPYPVFPRVAFTISVVCMIGIVYLAIDAVVAYVQMPEWASGVDYLGFFMYPVLCMPKATIGAISSAFCGIKTTITWVKIVSFVMLSVFGMILFLCFMGMGNLNGVGRIFGWFANLFVG